MAKLAFRLRRGWPLWVTGLVVLAWLLWTQAGVVAADGDADDDGVPDEVELTLGLDPFLPDSDFDGISDGVETNYQAVGWGGAPDTDGDTVIDALDEDSDGDGQPDHAEGQGDFDGDGVGNWRDADDDGDGIPTAVECGPLTVAGVSPWTWDADRDGLLNCYDRDTDGDTLLDSDEGVGDADGDGLPNYLDPNTSAQGDADGDGLSDAEEVASGCLNPLRADSDGDGFLDGEEGYAEAVDTDGDTVPDACDPDDDGDGIPTERERTDEARFGATFTRQGRLPAYRNLDSDGDTLPDADEAYGRHRELGVVDADRDGIPDYFDTNSDNDGRSDQSEGMGDADGDGVPNFRDPDDADGPSADGDGDGINNSVESLWGMDAYHIDSDGDGLLDEHEFRFDAGLPVDTDQDGRIDPVDEDDDDDGIPSDLERRDAELLAAFLGMYPWDVDQDGDFNWYDVDADGDGHLDRLERRVDTDGDGIYDYLDLDSDGDGVGDLEEAHRDGDADGWRNRVDSHHDDGPTADADGDGISNLDEARLGTWAQRRDSDGDSVSDTIEVGVAFLTGGEDNPRNSDGDAWLDALDVDDDDDLIWTATERADAFIHGEDLDQDGQPHYLDLDSDGDGHLDLVEGAWDADGDGVPNYLDEDSDGDGVPDRLESGEDGNGNGIPAFLDPTENGLDDPDPDGDGLPTAIEVLLGTNPYVADTDGDTLSDGQEVGEDWDNPIDTDGDTLIDALDPDDDGDGIPTRIEIEDSTLLGNSDVDGDGRLNWHDDDADGDGVPDGVEGREDGNNNGVPAYLDPTEQGPVAPDSVEQVDAVEPDASEASESFLIEGHGQCACRLSATGASPRAPLVALLLGALLFYLLRRRRLRAAS